MAEKTKVIVGLSGGVDSSVTALLLKQQGYQVEGLFMKNWEEDDGTEYCTALADLADAQAVADRLNIPLHTANFAAEYWDNVFTYFLREYRHGRTPNPDILCNKEIKFKLFVDYAKILGADKIATGHYARIQNQTRLLRGVDPDKDQSYFLHALTGPQLKASLFPLGELTKKQVRQIAKSQGLATHAKKDSTGICFIGERRFSDFLKRYLPVEPGPIISVLGQTLGKHQGLMYYTIGQRQGLQIGGQRGCDEAPWYVVEKRMQDNALVVAQGSHHPALFAQMLMANETHWINGIPDPNRFHCTAKIRYRQPDQACEVVSEPNGVLRVIFKEPQKAIAPGQFIVFYDQDFCLGGATIMYSSGV